MKNNADLRWHYPMLGFAKSFNISVTVAVLLTSLINLNYLGKSDLNEIEKLELKLQWLLGEFEYPDILLKRLNIELPNQYINDILRKKINK